jgi:hypothetical protein
MANANKERSALWRQLKELGWAPDRPFVNYSLEDLRAEVKLFSDPGSPDPLQAPGQTAMGWHDIVLQEEATASVRLDGETYVVEDVELPPFPDYGTGPGPLGQHGTPPAPEGVSRPQPAVSGPDPNELPGQRTNTQPLDEPIRIDEAGRAWYQEEVLKPSYPKPRGRRVLRYQETGVEQVTVQDGQYTETFEVAGSGPSIPAEVKITLPSYQVGIYKDPRFPFKVHTYNGTEGFDLFEVEEFYGGSELVPATVKRTYVENHLCYDIRSVIRTIEAEHRQLQLTGRI